jgi:hypothetical protein
VLGVVTSRQAPDTTWPRPYDPAKPFDFSGVAGVTPDQERRASDLLAQVTREAERWADYDIVVASGWTSFGDALSGFEHVINTDLIDDGYLLDPTRPESIVYRVNGRAREFAALMFLAPSGKTLDDSDLLDYGGRLMQWHNHSDMCMLYLPGNPVPSIGGFVRPDGGCDVAGAEPAKDANAINAMVHVWVVANPCGPFAAMEGRARGTALDPLDERVDLCH